MSTKSQFETYLGKAREAARAKVLDASMRKVQALRAAEKTESREGISSPYSSWRLDQFERLQAKDPARFKVLAETSEPFRERFRKVADEVDDCLADLAAEEDRAVVEAVEGMPADVRLRVQHEDEVERFKLSSGFDDPVSGPPAVRQAYRDLLKRQAAEVNP